MCKCPIFEVIGLVWSIALKFYLIHVLGHTRNQWSIRTRIHLAHNSRRLPPRCLHRQTMSWLACMDRPSLDGLDYTLSRCTQLGMVSFCLLVVRMVSPLVRRYLYEDSISWSSVNLSQSSSLIPSAPVAFPSPF